MSTPNDVTPTPIRVLNPYYSTFRDLYWTTCRDAYYGEEVIKQRREIYLKPSSGMVIDGMGEGQPGRVAYDNYLSRASFPDYFSDAVETYVGMILEKPPVIELPTSMQYLLEGSTIAGESAVSLLRRIYEKQLTSGRLGLLVEMPVSAVAGKEFYIALYEDISITNWDSSSDWENKDVLRLVDLNESCQVADENGAWHAQLRYRRLMLNGEYQQTLEGAGVDEQPITPVYKGQPATFIPFVFVNSCDLLPMPRKPPLMNLVRLCMSIYRQDADYKHALFMTGQDTLVVIGGLTSDGNGDSTRVGAGAKIDLPVGGDAKYIGVNSQGLTELRKSLEDDKSRAAVLSGKLVTNNKTNQESGESLKVRLAAQTATLKSIAITGAEALQTAFRFIARWMGEDESKVNIKPNLEFAALNLMGDDLVKLMTAKTLGAPISLLSMHKLLQERGLTNLEYQDELDKIKAEPSLATVQASTKAAGIDSQAKPPATA